MGLVCIRIIYHIQNVHYQLFILVHNIIFKIDPRLDFRTLDVQRYWLRS